MSICIIDINGSDDDVIIINPPPKPKKLKEPPTKPPIDHNKDLILEIIPIDTNID
jgi:hypothetical protein